MDTIPTAMLDPDPAVMGGRPRSVSPSVMPRRRGRPCSAVLSVPEVAQLLELPEKLIRARARFSFFPGAKEDESLPGGWAIPRAAVETALRTRLQPFYSIQTAARLLDVGYTTLFRQTAAVASLEDPLPPGRRVRALFLFLADGKPMKRIPESELDRLMGGRRA